MHISIAGRLRPFSHTPGSHVLLPGSFLKCTVFPTLLVVEDISEIEPKSVVTIEFDLKGPVKDFTVCQDLEKERILIWGHYSQGFVRYCLTLSPSLDSLELKFDRVPKEGISLSNPSKKMQAQGTISFHLSRFLQKPKPPLTRLSLGSHKAQDIDLIRRREDLAEIFPLWFRLGKTFTFQQEKTFKEGNFLLLEACREAIDHANKEGIYQTFKNLFSAGFEGLLSPRLYDFQYQGFGAEPPGQGNHVKTIPLNILTESAALIEKLFLELENNQVKILPLVPSQFHAGRMVNVACGEFGELDLEWSKKTIRRMVFRSKLQGEILFLFQKPLKTYRLRSLDHAQGCGSFSKSKGAMISIDQPLHCKPNHTYFFDRFEK